MKTLDKHDKGHSSEIHRKREFVFYFPRTGGCFARNLDATGSSRLAHAYGASNIALFLIRKSSAQLDIDNRLQCCDLANIDGLEL